MPDDEEPRVATPFADYMVEEMSRQDLLYQNRLLSEGTPFSAGTHSGPLYYDGETFNRNVDPATLDYWKRSIASKSVISEEMLAGMSTTQARAVMMAMQEDDRRWVFDPRQRVYTTLMKKKKPLNNRGAVEFLAYLAKRAREM